MTPEPGIHLGVPFPEYQAWDAINHHTLWTLREQCPANARYEQQFGTRETEALAFGTLTDFVLLEPGRFAAEAAVEPDIGEQGAPKRPTQRQLEAQKPSPATVAAIEFWRQWDDEHVGKIVVTRADYDRVLQIEARVRSAQCKEYICGGRSQVCLVWRDPVTGLLCKARLDYERELGLNHAITDLKTSRSAHESYWRWALYHYGYFQQLAWYEWGWRALRDESSLCGWLIAEKEGYCGVVYRQCDDETLRAGAKSFRKALDRWADCLARDEWPFYSGGLIGLERWALEREGVGPHEVVADKAYTGGTPPEQEDEFDRFLRGKDDQETTDGGTQ